MRKAAVVMFALIAGAALLAAITLFVLLRTPPGRGIVASILEAEISKAIGSETQIGRIEGALPNHLVIHDLSLANGETWLTVERVELDWRALRSLGGDIRIDRLAFIRAHLLREPPSSEEPQPDEPFKPPRLPADLPRLSIADLAIDDFQADPAIAGRIIRLDGAGKVAMDGRALNLRFEASGDNDTASATVMLDPRESRGVVDILVASEADGVIATLLDLDGRLFVEATGDAPLSDFTATFEGDLGAYGVIAGDVSGNGERANTLRIDATLRPGSKLSGISAELGDQLSLDATMTQSEDRLALEVHRFASAAGAASGVINWTWRGDKISAAEGSLRAAFAPEYRSDIQSYVGDSADLNFAARMNSGGFEVNASLTAPRLSATIAEGATDLRSRLAGRLTASLAPNPHFPEPLREGFSARSFVALIKGARSQFDDLRIETPDGSVFQGEASFDAASEQVQLAGDVIFEPALIALLIDNAKAQGPLRAHVTASGRLDALSGKANVDTPAVAVSGGWLPASAGAITFIRRESGFAAELSAKAKEGGGSLAAQASLVDGALNVSRFDLASKNFSVKATGVYRRNAQSAEIDLAYKGDGPAQPWPGLTLAGEIGLKGAIGRDSGANNLVLTASGVRSDDFEFAKLNAAAEGPSRSLSLTVDAEGIVLPVIGPSHTLQAAGVADLGEPLKLTLTRFESSAQGVDAKLTSAATFTFADSISVKGLKASLGRRGSLALDGSLSDSRWVAAIALKDAPVASADAFATLNLDLDTDRKTLARGDFVARAGLAETEVSTITGNFVWDGNRLRVTNDNAKDAIELDATLPLVLVRKPKLSAKFAGPLRGRAAYDGRIEAFAPYLPYTLQALEGALKGEATLAGTVDAPEVRGAVEVTNGAYTELASGLSFVGIRGTASATAGQARTVFTFDAGARGVRQQTETVTIKGTATLGDPARFDSIIKFNGTRLAAGPVTSATATGEITLSGPIHAIDAKGELTLNELDAEIPDASSDDLVEINVVTVDSAAPIVKDEPPPAPPLILAIALSGNDRIFVRGRGLESEWRANLRLTGDARAPLITGQMDLRKGYLDFAGRRFELQPQGRISFDRFSPNNPTLDLRAEHEAEGVTATISIKGRAKTPVITLSSTPALPQEDVMAIILFGKPATELSPLESLQVAEALAQLTGVGPFGGRGITSIARSALGLDMLNLDIDADTGSSALEVGKYVANGLFISATQDARGENGAVRIEYEITNSITVETELQQDGDQTISANWKRDF